MKIYDYFYDLPDYLKGDKISENAEWLLNQRYYLDRYDSEKQEIRKENSFAELAQRVARIITSAETLYKLDTVGITWLRQLEKNIKSDILNRRFLFNSPCLFSAGAGLTTIPEYSKIIYDIDVNKITFEDYTKLLENKSDLQQLFACFVIPIEDSIEGIFESVKQAGIISKYGGGVGTNFGQLRECGALIKGGAGGTATGPVSFMQTWDTMGGVVVQGGKRRAALMGMLFDNHPDIEQFIDCKTEDGKLSYFNISVALSDKFMQAVENDGDFELISRVDNKSVVKTVKARTLFNHLCESAWKRGDPGIFFIDSANKDNILKTGGNDWVIESTNPCGEQPLPNYTSCNLGSINLEKFIHKATGNFDFAAFIAQIYRAIYYLDLVIDACSYPLGKIEERTKAIRPVGLGIMGLADAAIMRGLKYGAPGEFFGFCESISRVLAVTSLEASIRIVTDCGKKPFGENYLVKELMSSSANLIPTTLKNTLNVNNAKKEYFEKELKKGNLRNSRRLSIAPTGSISMLLDTSSSIEPNFAYHWSRRVTKNDGTGYEMREYWHKLLPPKEQEEYKKTGKINNELFVTAHDVTPMQHVDIMSVFAQYIDSAISKTVNLPNSATVEDVKQVYLACYNAGCKGITIYRDGSRSLQPIQTAGKKQNEQKTQVKKRPNDYVAGKTIKDNTPWGSLYVTLNTDSNNKPFEVFINIGKSGSEYRAMTEALARAISLGLRAGVNLEDFIATIENIIGADFWELEHNQKLVKSMPDAIAELLKIIS